jgi:hypothetical protein
MPSYNCLLCNKIFNQKCHYENHISRKKTCIKKNVVKNFLECPYCEKIFCRKDYFNLHVKQYCKNKKYLDNMELVKEKINNLIMLENTKKIIDDNKKIIEIVENYENIIKNNDLIKNILPSVNINNNNNNKNNGTINNGILNNTTINNIVQFGKEDISKFNIKDMMNNFTKSTGGNIYPNMLRYINLNPNFPENNNICMTDLAREIVKIYNGTKFVSKKFKNVKDEILNTINNHIMNMCDTYMEDPKIKKTENILKIIKTNNISTKLINNDDITPLLTIKKIKNKDENTLLNSSDDDSVSEYLDEAGEKELIRLENKRQGLQEITINKIKDELYNNRDLIEKKNKN